jgi:hypothetical protein
MDMFKHKIKILVLSIIGLCLPIIFVEAKTNHIKREWDANELCPRSGMLQINQHVSAPLVSATYPTMLIWKWHHQDPYRWNVYVVNGTRCMHQSDYWKSGNSRQFAPDGGGEKMFVVGIDAFGNEITKPSNVVIPDEAPIPRK